MLSILKPLTHWPCVLCAADNALDIGICQSCYSDLPWNKNACVQCAIPMTISALRCGACQKRPPQTDITLAPLLFLPPVNHLLSHFKFNQKLNYGKLLATIFTQQLISKHSENNALPDAIIPVPLHHSRLKERGYDQALELAKLIGKAIHRPVLKQALHRTKHTQPLANMTALERRRAIRNAFELDASVKLPAHIALIDDVMTTGSTLFEAAKTVRRGYSKGQTVHAEINTEKITHDDEKPMPDDSGATPAPTLIQTWAIARTPITRYT